jgi:hypothetical protein
MKVIHFALVLMGVGSCFAQSTVQTHTTAGSLLFGPFDDDNIVTGRPYIAEAVLETNKTLANGTPMTSSQIATVARDSQGRTRREENLRSPAGDSQMKNVFIGDPVEQVSYMLGPNHIAHKLPWPNLASSQSYAPSIATVSALTEPLGTLQVQQFSTANSAAEIGGRTLNQPGESRTEALGTRMIGGAQTEGSRTTVTIPAGQAGNQNPIVITDERWYSQDLQTTVLAKHSDSRFGESSYQLTNIQRTEPPASLFQVPSDYTVAGSGR